MIINAMYVIELSYKFTVFFRELVSVSMHQQLETFHFWKSSKSLIRTCFCKMITKWSPHGLSMAQQSPSCQIFFTELSKSSYWLITFFPAPKTGPPDCTFTKSSLEGINDSTFIAFKTIKDACKVYRLHWSFAHSKHEFYLIKKSFAGTKCNE